MSDGNNVAKIEGGKMTLLEWIKWLFGGGKKPPVPVPPPKPPIPGGDGLLYLHNAERQRLGRMSLTTDYRLTIMAQEHTQQMAAKGQLNHDNFVQRLEASGYVYSSAEENATVTLTNDPNAAWANWVESPKHYANAVNPDMRDVGFGSAYSTRDGQTYWCAVYGAPR